MNPYSKNPLSEAFHIYVDGSIPISSREFRIASNVLYKEIYPIALNVAYGFNNIHIEPEELINTFMIRLYQNKRSQPFEKINGVPSYVKTALTNIAIDIYRREIKYIAPEDDSGKRQRKQSLDVKNDDGKTLYDYISAPEEEEEENNAWDILAPIQEQLENYLYEKEIYFLSHKTPKGKKTFEQEANNFQAYRDNQYSPSGSPYKKFTRQRTRMLEHLEEKRDTLLVLTPSAANFLEEFAQEQNLATLKSEVQDDLDSTKQERRIQARFDLLAFYQYTKGNSYDENDPIARALFINAITSLFHEQLYRTQR